MKEPHTVREAWMAQVLADLDTLLTRIEALPAAVEAAERRLQASAAALTAAGDGYRRAVRLYTDEAKRELTEHAARCASAIAPPGAAETAPAPAPPARRAAKYAWTALAVAILAALLCTYGGLGAG